MILSTLFLIIFNLFLNYILLLRTWQPRWMNDNHTEEIAQEDIFTPGDFVIDL